MDVVDRATRSRMMRSIRGKDTKPEVRVRRALHARGLRFRLHDGSLPGRPDIVIKKYKVVIFVNGCFWHGHEGCKYFHLPATNPEFWRLKISGNRERDSRNIRALRDHAWRVAIVWECAVRFCLEAAVEGLVEFVVGASGELEIAAHSDNQPATHAKLHQIKPNKTSAKST